MVVDAKVRVKWFFPEKVEALATEALALPDRCGKNEIQIIIPDLFWERESRASGRKSSCQSEHLLTVPTPKTEVTPWQI
jgi:hypothetical protein